MVTPPTFDATCGLPGPSSRRTRRRAHAPAPDGQMPSAFVTASLAQLLVNTIYGSGAVVSAIGLLDGMHPVLFGFVRATICASAFGVWWLWQSCRMPQPLGLRELALSTDRWKLLVMGGTLFTGNLFNLLGVSIAGAAVTSLWQPTQPVFTLILAVMLGSERLTPLRTAGILLSTVGCMVMIATSAAPKEGRHHTLLGSLMLLLNCLSTPLCIIASKALMGRGYPKLLLSACCFSISSAMFALTIAACAALAALAPQHMAALLCSQDAAKKCVWTSAPDASGVPLLAWVAVVWMAIVVTMLPFLLQLFAANTLRASLVSAFYTVQPVAALLCSAIFFLLTPPPHLGMRQAQATDLIGGLAVSAGLLITVYNDMRTPPDPAPSGALATVELERKADPADRLRLLDEGGDASSAPTSAFNSKVASCHENLSELGEEPPDADELSPVRGGAGGAAA